MAGRKTRPSREAMPCRLLVKAPLLKQTASNYARLRLGLAAIDPGQNGVCFAFGATLALAFAGAALLPTGLGVGSTVEAPNPRRCCRRSWGEEAAKSGKHGSSFFARSLTSLSASSSNTKSKTSGPTADRAAQKPATPLLFVLKYFFSNAVAVFCMSSPRLPKISGWRPMVLRSSNPLMVVLI